MTPRPAPRAAGCGEGFLLAEALVTMAIGAFLLVALVSLVHLMTRADARAADVSRRIETESRAFDALARDLRPALRTRWGGAGTPFVFAGTETFVQFAMRDPAVGDIRLVTLQATAGPRRGLVRTSAAVPPYASGPGDLVGGETSAIDTGASVLRFSYVQSVRGGGEIEVDRWTAPLEMPAAVHVSLVDPASGGVLSSLRIPLMIDAEPGCASPRRGVCSYVETGEADAIDAADLPPEAVDPGDPLGWLRYAR